MKDLKADAKKIIESAINSVKPDLLIRRKMKIEDQNLQVDDFEEKLNSFENIYVVGAGKASAEMGRAVESLLKEKLTGGVISVKYGHGKPCRKIQVLEAGHPVLDQGGLSATEKILGIAEKAGEKDLVICLISGGGSALLESLPENILLKDLQDVFELLLKSGANIEEINAVRKHLSRVKGGQLARAISPATCVSLILSDVIGDPLDAIASGPTAADSTTFYDAWEVMRKYRLKNKISKSVHKYLENGTNGTTPETLKPGDPIFKNVHNIIIGNNLEALKSASDNAAKMGYNTMILSSRIQGEAKEVAKVLTAIVKEIQINNFPVSRPACVLMGGETTVTIKGEGEGGRNQELVLAAFIEMKQVEWPYIIVSLGTDGTDGPTDAAGGMVHPSMWKTVMKKNINPQKFLENNDSYNFLKNTNGLIKTGPTGTNVMDIVFALIP